MEWVGLELHPEQWDSLGKAQNSKEDHHLGMQREKGEVEFRTLHML